MSHSDDVAMKAKRKSTLTSLKAKKSARLQKLKNDYENEVRKVNIEYAKDPERLKAKYAAADYAKSERAKKRAERKIEKETKVIDYENSLRPFTFGEELATSIVQGIGTAFAVVVLALFDSLAVKNIEDYVKNVSILSYTCFGIALILMYLSSTLNHALTNYTAKEVFRRLSHVFTFMVIGCGYTAFNLTKFQDPSQPPRIQLFGWILFGSVWLIAIVGSVLYAVFGSRFEKGIVAFFVATGWSGLFVTTVLYKSLNQACFTLLAVAGLIYLVGLIFYSLRKVKFMHLVGNCVMLAGSVCMFLSLFYINLPR